MLELVNPVSPVCTTLYASLPSGITPLLDVQAVNNKDTNNIAKNCLFIKFPLIIIMPALATEHVRSFFTSFSFKQKIEQCGTSDLMRLLVAFLID